MHHWLCKHIFLISFTCNDHHMQMALTQHTHTAHSSALSKDWKKSILLHNNAYDTAWRLENKVMTKIQWCYLNIIKLHLYDRNIGIFNGLQETINQRIDESVSDLLIIDYLDIHKSANGRQITKTEKYSYGARMSQWKTLRHNCQAVQSRS